MNINHVTLATAIHTLKLKQKTKDTIIKRMIANAPCCNYRLKQIYKLHKKQGGRYACMQLRAMFNWKESNEGSRFWIRVHQQLENQFKPNS